MLNKERINKKFVIVSLLTLTLIVGLLTGLIQNGLRYSVYKEQIQVQIVPEVENSDEIINELSVLPNISRVDRINNEIYLQNIDLGSVNNSIEDAGLNESVIISTIIPSEDFYNKTSNLLIISLIFTLAVFFWSIFSAFIRNISQVNLKIFSYLFALNFFSVIIAFGLQLSILVVASTFYQIQNLDLYSIFIPVVIINLLFANSLTNSRLLSNITFEKIMNIFQVKMGTLEKYLSIVSLLLVLPLMLALGSYSVIPLILIFIALNISYLTVNYIFSISALINRDSKLSNLGDSAKDIIQFKNNKTEKNTKNPSFKKNQWKARNKKKKNKR